MIDQSWRLLIADQSLCFLELLQIQLSSQSPKLRVDIASSLSSMEVLIHERNYDLIIVSDQLNDASLIEAIKHLSNLAVHAKFAAFCYTFNKVLLLQHNLKLINNLISKKESLSSLVLAIHRICMNEIYISPHIQHLIRVDDKMNVVLRQDSAICQLSPRQINVLTLLANGLSVKEVAKELHLSPKSVDSHKYRLMLKLQIKDRVELARFAIREGLIDA